MSKANGLLNFLIALCMIVLLVSSSRNSTWAAASLFTYSLVKFLKTPTTGKLVVTCIREQQRYPVPTVIEEEFVHFNQAILKHSGLNSLEPNVVLPYLTKALQ